MAHWLYWPIIECREHSRTFCPACSSPNHIQIYTPGESHWRSACLVECAENIVTSFPHLFSTALTHLLIVWNHLKGFFVTMNSVSTSPLILCVNWKYLVKVNTMHSSGSSLYFGSVSKGWKRPGPDVLINSGIVMSNPPPVCHIFLILILAKSLCSISPYTVLIRWPSFLLNFVMISYIMHVIFLDILTLFLHSKWTHTSDLTVYTLFSRTD